jgi:hypothetical protein
LFYQPGQVAAGNVQGREVARAQDALAPGEPDDLLERV